jgi:hypothetical protein
MVTKTRRPRQSNTERDGDPAGSYASYLEYNKILRTWFVAFGVGGPALFLVNKEVAERLVKLGELRLVAILFLSGAATQVFGALLNKFANWYVYSAALDTEQSDHWKYAFAHWLIDQFWVDVLLDLITIVCYGAAIWQVLTAFAVHG